MIAQENEMDNSVKITSTPGVGKKVAVWIRKILPNLLFGVTQSFRKGTAASGRFLLQFILNR